MYEHDKLTMTVSLLPFYNVIIFGLIWADQSVLCTLSWMHANASCQCFDLSSLLHCLFFCLSFSICICHHASLPDCIYISVCLLVNNYTCVFVCFCPTTVALHVRYRCKLHELMNVIISLASKTQAREIIKLAVGAALSTRGQTLKIQKRVQVTARE